MTIELITGNPGSGKTTYAVSRRVAVESKRMIGLPDDECIKLGLPPGTEVPRVVYQAGIKGLLVEHERLPHTLTGERLDEREVEFWNEMRSDGAVHQRSPQQPLWGPSEFAAAAAAYPKLPAEWFRPSLFNWWLWARPGALIVVDEVQFIVPRGTVGRKPPQWIALLEIHRHYGIDFMFITQHPQLLDTTIRALVGLHRHVRSAMGSSFCMVYVWDHASNPERFTNANKQTFKRGPADYALFKSAVAHVKPPTSGRSIFVVVPLLIAVVVFFAWRGSAPFRSVEAAVLVAPAGPSVASAASVRPLRSAGGQPEGVAVKVRACWATATRCECFADRGMPVYLPDALCRRSAAGFGGVVRWEPQDPPLSSNYGAAARSADPAAAAASVPWSSAIRLPPT